MKDKGTTCPIDLPLSILGPEVNCIQKNRLRTFVLQLNMQRKHGRPGLKRTPILLKKYNNEQTN